MCIFSMVAWKLLRAEVQYIMILCYRKKMNPGSTSEWNTVAHWPITSRVCVCLLILPSSLSAHKK